MTPFALCPVCGYALPMVTHGCRGCGRLLSATPVWPTPIAWHSQAIRQRSPCVRAGVSGTGGAANSAIRVPG
jgi:hypothetical protein